MVGKISLVKTFKMKLGTEDFNGGFLKWGYPQIIYFNGLFHSKPTILGSPKHVFHPIDEDLNPPCHLYVFAGGEACVPKAHPYNCNAGVDDLMT